TTATSALAPGRFKVLPPSMPLMTAPGSRHAAPLLLQTGRDGEPPYVRRSRSGVGTVAEHHRRMGGTVSPEASKMKRRMLRGELYIADDPELAADFARAQALLERFNACGHDQQALRDQLVRELFGEVGDGVVI